MPTATKVDEERVLRSLREIWAADDVEHFARRLPMVTIRLQEVPGYLGTYNPATRQVTISPSIFTGRAPDVRTGNKDELGLLRFARDVLLHEAAHAYLDVEFGGQDGQGVHGFHDVRFLAVCQQMTPSLSCIRRSALQRLTIETCGEWPHNIRKKRFYRGAYVYKRRGKS